MIERLDKALKIAINKYIDSYLYEFDNKQDSDLSDEQYNFVKTLINEVMMLYWIKYGDDVKVTFDSGSISIKYPTGDKRTWDKNNRWN